MELEDGQRVTVASEERVLIFATQSDSPSRKITCRGQALLHGIAQEMMAGLNASRTQLGTDEFIIDTPVAQGHTCLTSLRPLVQAHNAVEVF